jgi:hypothetical protein
MDSLEADEYLSLTHRPDLGVLVARWLRQPLPEELHQGYWQMLDVALAQQCRYWLVDARRRANANQQNTRWMMETFFPVVGAKLGHSVYLAFLFAPSHLAEIEADSSVPPLTYFDDRPYHVQRFTDEHHAMEWLVDCQREKLHRK